VRCSDILYIFLAFAGVTCSVRDERKWLIPIGCMGIPHTPDFKLERMVSMKFGTDFFKILNLVIMFMRLYAKVFGDDADRDAVDKSESRTARDNVDEAC